MNRFLNWLGVQDALKKGLITRILVYLCLLFIAFGVFFVLFRIYITLDPNMPDAHWTDMIIEPFILLTGLATLYFIRKDELKSASRIIIAGLLVAVSLQAYFIGDPLNDIAGAMGLLLFAFMAILLLDGLDRWIAIFAVVAVFIMLNILAASGNLAPAIYLDPFNKTIFIFFVWLAVGIIITIVMIAAMGAMRREPQLIQQQLAEMERAGTNGSAKGLPFISTHDDMTGLYNRLFFETELARLEKSRLYPISIIMAGIQDLHKVIDSFGSAAGDQLVINVARQMAKAFRNEDIVTRYGPDEFAVILPSTDAAIVGVITNRIYKQVAAYNADHGKIPLNITLGYSTANKGEPLKKHLKAADKMMREGRKASD